MPLKKRDSSIELLRIITMFMILLVHTNYFVFGEPTDHSMTSFLRCLFEALTVSSVLVFMLITGYYGTRFSFSKIAGLVYQVLFCVVVISTFYVIKKGTCQLYDYMFWHYWFVNAYIGVVICAPLVNAAIKSISQRQFKAFLVLFYVFLGIGEYVCGLFGGGILKGYSLIWFLYIYMIGRYLRMYPTRISTTALLLLFVGSLTAHTLLLYTTLGYTDFVNPFIIIQSVCILLLFTRLSFQSKTVNYIASSTLMVYLVSMHIRLAETYKDQIRYLYESSSSTAMFIVQVAVFCVGVFVCAIALGKVCQWTWKPLSVYFTKLDDRYVTYVSKKD